MIPCHGCLELMERPYLMTPDGDELCRVCANPPTLCTLCDEPTTPADALPFPNPNPSTVAHFMCVGRLQRSIGWGRSVVMVRLMGPAFRGRA